MKVGAASPLKTPRRPNVVIIGAGFAGLSAAKGLAASPFDVTIIDRHNYHLFQPLLYQVATAGLSPADIAYPIRSILRHQKNTNVILANVSGVDLVAREILAEDRRIPYDILIIATGARHAYFGRDDWAPHAPGLKRIDDATYVRQRILVAFEKAEAEPDAIRRRALLNFVVVGGGPTGVEMAGAIAELARKALAADFRTIDPRDARVILVQSAPRLLVPFDPTLSENARQSLLKLNVEVRTRSARDDVRRQRRVDRRGTHRSRNDHLGGRCNGLSSWDMAWRRDRQCRSGQGSTRSFDPGPSRYFRGRRYGVLC